MVILSDAAALTAVPRPPSHLENLSKCNSDSAGGGWGRRFCVSNGSHKVMMLLALRSDLEVGSVF